MNLRDAFRNNQTWAMVISYVAVIGMVTCLGIAFQPILNWVLAGEAQFISLTAFLISVECVVSFRILRLLAREGQERMYYRISEIIILVLALKLLIELRHGVAYFLQNIAQWQSNFVDSFFSYEYLAVLIAMGLIWGLTWWYGTDLVEMETDEFILSAASAESVPSNRRDIHRGLIGRVLTIGWLVVIVTVLGQYGLIPGQGQVDFSNVIAYFIFGLLLLSQTNFAAWRAAWGYERVTINRNLAQRWLFYSLGFLFVIVILALLLPTRYAYSLFPTLVYLLSLLVAVVQFLLGLFLFPIIWFIGLLARLFQGDETQVESLLPPTFLPPEPITGTAAAIPWLALLKSIAFWAVFILIVVLALAQYARQNEQVAQFLRRIFRWRWAMKALDWLRETFGGVQKNLAAMLQAGLNRLRTTRPNISPDAWHFINPRRLSTRQRVLFYYLALVRRASETGVLRRPSQTPQEYTRNLSAVHPEVAPDLAAMTDAFIEARYTQHPVSDEQAGLVRRFWDHVRRALRGVQHRKL
jgi:hypothetical protein